MPDAFIRITVSGEEKLIKAIKAFPREMQTALRSAGKESGNRIIINTEGLKKYPPTTAANRPPFPYYQRGLGTWTSPGHNTKSSEKLGNHWYVKPHNAFGTEIGNSGVSYAPYVHGDDQATQMGPNARIPKGWRKLTEVVTEKLPQISVVYNQWIKHTLERLGLM